MTKKLSGPEWVTSWQKRSFDVALAAAAIGPAALISLDAAAAIALRTRESPLFRQRRPGRGGEFFTINKLRTMPTGTPDTRSDRDHDTRATDIGAFLRERKIDELPQVVNVLKGDMSWVGPRPLVACHMSEMLDELPPRLHKPWLDAYNLCRPGVADPYLAKVYSNEVTFNPIDWAETIISYAQEGTPADDRQTILAVSGIYRHLAAERLSTI